jgi:hypothetical protein
MQQALESVERCHGRSETGRCRSLGDPSGVPDKKCKALRCPGVRAIMILPGNRIAGVPIVDSLVRLLFRRSGGYVGFLADGWFFDMNGRYLGWYEPSGRVWKRDGTFLGHLFEEHYVLRPLNFSPPVRQTPKVPPVAPEPPPAPHNRPPLWLPPAWTDALDSVGRRPEWSDLVGAWENSEGRLLLRADERFVWSVRGGERQSGRWAYRGNILLTPDAEEGQDESTVVYQIVEFERDILTLRWMTTLDHILPLTLHRVAYAAAGR